MCRNNSCRALSAAIANAKTSRAWRGKSFLCGLLALLALTLFATPKAGAIVYYWDANGQIAGFPAITGGWNGTNQFWNTDSTGGAGGTVVASPTSSDDLNVTAGATGTITISTVPGTGSSLTISDNVAVTVTGGTLALGGNGTYSGLFVTSADNSATNISSPLTLNNQAVTIQNAGTGVVTISGGITGAQNLILQNNNSTASGITISTASLNNGGTVTNSGGGPGSVTVSVAIGANVNGVTENSPNSALILSAANSFSGGLTINSGTASGSQATSFGPSSGTITVGNTSGVAPAFLISTASVTVANPIAVQAGSSGPLNGLTIQGTVAPFFSGPIALNNNLTVDSVTSGDTTTFSNTITAGSNAVTIAKGIGAGAVTISGPIVVGSGGVTIANMSNYVSSTGILTVSGGVSGTGPLTLANYLGVAGGVALPSGTINNNGLLTITADGAGSGQIAGGSITIGAVIGANVTGLVVQGEGNVTLSTTNLYTGGTTLTAGLLKISNSSALGNNGPLTINGGVIDVTAAVATLTVSGQTWNGNWSFNGSNNLNMGTAPVTLGQSIAIGAYYPTSTLTIGGNIGQSSPNCGMTLVSSNQGNITLAGSNSYTGPTSLIGGGGVITLVGSNATSGITVNDVNLTLGTSTVPAVPSVLGTGMLTILQGSTITNPNNSALNLSTNNNQTWAGDFNLSLNGANGTINFGSGTVTLTGNRTIYNVTNSSGTVSVGAISDGGNNYSLTNDGSTNLHITGASTYTGGTVLNPGYYTMHQSYNYNNPSLSLDFNAAGAPSANLLWAGSALTMNSAWLAVNGAASTADSQTLGNFNLSGENQIVLTPSGGTTTLVLGNWTRTGGGTLYANLSAAGSSVITSSPITSVSSTLATSSTATILPYVIVYGGGGTGFGIVVGGNIVRYAGATTLAAGNIPTSTPSTNYTYPGGGNLTLSGPTTINSLALTGATTLDLQANTLTLGSGTIGGALLDAVGNSTIKSSGGTGTLTANGNELVLTNQYYYLLTLTSSVSIANNSALTTAGQNTSSNPGVTIQGNVSSTPIINLNSLGGTTISGAIGGGAGGLNTINLGMKIEPDTIGALGTIGGPLGNTLTINSLSEAATAFSGLVNGNGSTVLTINNNIPTNASQANFTFSGGMTGVSTINYSLPNNSILFLGTNNPKLVISGATAVTGLAALNLSDYALNTISSPMTLGPNFAVTETNAGYLTISSATIIGNGSTAISFVAPNLNNSGGGMPNTVSGGAISGIASISNDGGAPLAISSSINIGATNNLKLANSSLGLLTVSGPITAGNLTIAGGNGLHLAWWGGSAGYSGGGLSLTQDEVDLSPTAANTFGSGNSGTTSVTDAMLYLDYSTSTVAKIGTGALTLSSALLAVSNASNASPTVASTTIAAGQSAVDLYKGTGALNLGTVTNSNFGTVNFTTFSLSTGGAIKATGATGSLIGGWATIGSDFAAINSSGIVVAPPTTTTLGVNPYTALVPAATGLGSAVNAKYTTTANTNLAMTAPIAANSLVINNSSALNNLDLTMSLSGNVALSTGGLLYYNTYNEGNGNIFAGNAMTITGTGTIFGDSGATGNSPLYVTANPMSTTSTTTLPDAAMGLLTITTPVVAAPAPATAGSGTLVKTGYGELIVTAPANYTGGTVINGGFLRADSANNALSTGPLVLNSGGAYATYGSFTQSITATASPGMVTFGPGGGGFSAEGGNLTVNLGGAGALVYASSLGGNLVVGNQVYSTGVLNFQNPIFMDEPLTITTAPVPDTTIIGTQSNLGTAYAKLSGGISGTGSLTFYGVGWHGIGGGPGATSYVALPDGMAAVPGGINVTGPIAVYGTSLYVPSMASLANNNVTLTNGGVIATSGTANITFGAGPGQVQFVGASPGTYGEGGFAAVGGPLVVQANGNQPWGLISNANGGFGPNAALNLGNAYSTNAVDYQSPLVFNGNTALVVDVEGPVPNILSGQILGGQSISNNNLLVAGCGVLVVSNSANNFTGNVTVGPGAMLRTASNGALGNTGAGSFYALDGTLDLNGCSFSGRTWNIGFYATTGPLGLPNLINSSTATATFGVPADIYETNTASGNFGNYYPIGGPGNIILPGKFAGNVAAYTTYNFKGTGTVTMTGDAANTFVAGSNIYLNESVNGMTLVLNYSADTATKILTGVTPGSTTAQQEFLMNGAALQLVGNANTPVTEKLPIIGGDYLGAPSTNAACVQAVGLVLNGGFNTVNATTTGANMALNVGSIVRSGANVGSTAFSSVDFSTNSTAGGSATINVGAAGYLPIHDTSLPITNEGSGYAASQSNIPITISPPGAGGVQAIGHAVSNPTGNITAVYIDNWGSGYTATPTITVGGGGTGAVVQLYFDHPVDNIIGGYATVNGTDWAYRDPTTGNITALPAADYTAANDPSTWGLNQNITMNNAGLVPTGMTSSGTISTLRITGSALTGTVNLGSNILTIGYGAAAAVGAEYMPGGILMTSAVGANNVTINGGSIAPATASDGFFIHQNDSSGTLTVTSAITDGNGGSGLVKDGPGALVLTNAANAYTGGTYVYGGTLQVPSVNNNGLASAIGTGNLTIQGSGTFQVNTGSSTSTNRLITLGIGGGALDASGAGTVVYNGVPYTQVGTDYYTEAVKGDGYSNLTLTGNGNGVMNGGIYLLTPPQSAGNYNGGANAAVVEGFTQVTKTGTGTWTLNAYNYWQGGTIINQGILALNLSPSANYLPGPASSGVNVLANTSFADAISANAPVEIDSGGTLQLNYPEVTGAVRLYGGTVTGTGALWGRSYDFRAGNVTVPMVGDFSAIAKTTAGLVTMTGTGSTYSGATTISAGTLTAGLANVLSPNSAVTVSGGLLDVSLGTQTVAALTVGPLGTLNLALSNAAVSSAVTVNGAASFAGTLNLFNTPSTSVEDLIGYQSYSGSFSTATGFSGYSLVYTSNELELVAQGPPTWKVGSGNWSIGSNWSSGVAPTGSGALAILGVGVSTSAAVTLDENVTLGTLQLGNTAQTLAGSLGYTVSGSNTLTMTNTGSNPSYINVTGGTHGIAANVKIAGGNLTVSLSSNGWLTMGNISDDNSARSLTLTGDGTGMLFLDGTDSYGLGTQVNAGELIAESPGALNPGTGLILGTGLFDFTLAKGSPVGSPLAAGGATASPAGVVGAVPEPGTLALLAVAGIVAAAAAWRKRKGA